MEPIRIVTDDVFVRTPKWTDPDMVFRKVHSDIVQMPNTIHVPSILVEETIPWQNMVQFIRTETKYSRMEPQIHGLRHMDYSKCSEDVIREHIDYCVEFLTFKFHKIPTIWYPPWGLSNSTLEKIAEEFYLEIRIPDPEWDIEKVYKNLKEKKIELKDLYGKEITVKWWKRDESLREALTYVKELVCISSLPAEQTVI